jgi:signal transduction histidine kinase
MLALVRRHPMQAQALDLNELIENQTGNLGRLLGKNIRLEKMCWESLPSIKADPGLVEQILHHLVVNARDAMPNGGTLTIGTAAVRVDEARARLQEEARPGACVCLTVADTGCGMTPEVQSHLFEPFFTTKETGKAAGLGLATVHGLVKQHGGWLEVSTQSGAGSRFTVFFPCGPSTGFTRRVVGSVPNTIGTPVEV